MGISIQTLWKKKRLRRWLIGIASAFTLYTILGFFVLPWIASSVAQSTLTEKLGRKTTIEDVRFNPYSLVLEIENLSISEAASEKRFAGFDLVRANISLSSLLRWALVVEDLRIERPFVRVERLANGQMNFSDLTTRLSQASSEDPPPNPSAEEEPASKPLVLHNLQIQGGKFLFIDAPKGQRHVLDQLDLSLPLVSMRADDRSDFIKPSLKARLNGKLLVLTGRTKPFNETLESGFNFELSDLDLVPLWAYVPLDPKPKLDSGSLSCKLFLAFHQADQPELNISGELTLDRLSLTGTTNEALLSLERVGVEVSQFNVFGNSLALKSVRLSRPKLPLTISPEGQLTLLRYVPPSKPANTDGTSKDKTRSPFKVTIQSFSLVEGLIPFTDLRPDTTFRKELGPIGVTVTGLDTSAGQADIALHVGPPAGENIELQGKFSLAPHLWTSGTISVKGLSLPHYAPYLKDIPAVVESASLETGTEFELAMGAEEALEFSAKKGWFKLGDVALSNPEWRGLKVQWDLLNMTDLSFVLASRQAKIGMIELEKLLVGLPRHNRKTPGRARLKSLKLSNLILDIKPLRIELEAVDLNRMSIREKAGVDLLFGFSQIALRGIVFEQSVNRLAINSTRIQTPVLNLAVEKSGNLNLARVLFGPQRPARNSDGSKSTGAPAAAAASNKPEMSLIFPRVALRQGNLRFRDHALKPPFAAGMHNIRVDLRGFSTLPGTRASLSAKADAGAQGTIEIQGAVNPNDDGLNPSIMLKVNGGDLTVASPYTQRFISHPIATGKLDASISLAVSNRKLRGHNKVVMTNFTLGEEEESPDDVGLPIGLVLMLIRDGDNGLELDVPVDGDLDDPSFALGKVIWRAIVNVVTKIATSPFTFLAGLVGGEDINMIAMEPGQTQIAAQSAGKIDLLVQAIKKRPGVRLTIGAIMDPISDGQSLTLQRVEQALKQQKISQSEDEDSTSNKLEMIQIGPAERPRLLELAAKAAGWKPPESMIKPAQVQQSQESFLREHLAAGTEELRQLGVARVEAVMQAISKDPDISKNRLFLRQLDRKAQEKASKFNRGVLIDIR